MIHPSDAAETRAADPVQRDPATGQSIQVLTDLPVNGILTTELSLPDDASLEHFDLVSDIPLDKAVTRSSSLDGGSLSTSLIELCIEDRALFVQTFGDFTGHYLILILTWRTGPT